MNNFEIVLLIRGWRIKGCNSFTDSPTSIMSFYTILALFLLDHNSINNVTPFFLSIKFTLPVVLGLWCQRQNMMLQKVSCPILFFGISKGKNVIRHNRRLREVEKWDMSARIQPFSSQLDFADKLHIQEYRDNLQICIQLSACKLTTWTYPVTNT